MQPLNKPNSSSSGVAGAKEEGLAAINKQSPPVSGAVEKASGSAQAAEQGWFYGSCTCTLFLFRVSLLLKISIILPQISNYSF